MSNRMAAQTQKTVGISNGMRTATIAAVSGSAVTISVAGGDFADGVGVVTSYAPVVGDNVAVFRQDSSWLVLGPVAAVNGWTLFSDLGYQNGWTDRGPGYPFGAYRRLSWGVQLVGQITNAAIQAAGAIIVTGLPAPPGEAAGMVAEQGTSRPGLHVDAAGALRIYNSSTTGIMQFSCSYPIDFLA
jgi:hypothetical protein